MEASCDLSGSLSASSSDDEAETLGPDQCICCKRSKTQGTFFAIRKRYWSHKWEWISWGARGHVFSAAAVQGCRRCRFVLDVVNAYMLAMEFSDVRYIQVRNERVDRGSMRALVRIDLSCPEFSGSRSLKLLHLAGILSSSIPPY